MPTVLSPEELKARFTGLKQSSAWSETARLYNDLRVHANGEMPIHLIKNARPNESDAVREYREKIYEPETQNPVERVIGVLEKIRRSPDWMIRFDEDVPAIIAKDETLEKYLKDNYPGYKSIEAWVFEEALKNVAIDANAVCIIMPKDLEVVANEYMKPIAQIFNATKVVDYVEGDFVIVRSEEYSSLLPPNTQQQRAAAQLASSRTDYANSKEPPYPVASQVYYVVNTITYQKWEETTEGKYRLTKQVAHSLNALPAFQLPGKFLKRMGSSVIKKTPLHPMVPHLNKAARESNDLDAGVIQHLYVEKWRINNLPCPDCNGTGKTVNIDGRTPATCKKCEGHGMATGKSPFNEIIIKPSAIGQQNIPTPPVGYVEKNVEIIKIQNDRIAEHIYKALASVNMEHLAESQLNQSGKAKEYDRDEINNLIYSFAESIVSLTSDCVYWINELRYSNIVQDVEKRKKMLPVIPVPEKFDVINSSFLLGEYSTAKTAGLNATILTEMQKEIAHKKFYANPKVAQFVQTIMELDPFPDKTVDEKASLSTSGLATKEDIILSSYISDFVNRAVEEDQAFLQKTQVQKREVLMKYAQEKVDALNTAKQLQVDLFIDPNSPKKPEDSPSPKPEQAT